ncbi:prostaglandin E synthase isoform X2 [Coturnix japonica]|uniref:prostaglandin E synthase isoform X2 n=1 Tax=Coturnix japonica TaxID=93934 RepID=UPI0013A5E53F|nr:prostaglandin E synthase isoform X2 [Coturnix japonica]
MLCAAREGRSVGCCRASWCCAEGVGSQLGASKEQKLTGQGRSSATPTMMGNTVFLSFAFYSTILILKMYVVAIITGQVRLRKKAFANPEDALRNGGLQYYREDPDVERCRRAHRNDMENIFPFLFLGAVYSLLDPSPAVARIHFFIFCVGRIVHTIAYLLKLRAPTRSVAYSVAQLPCFSMALQILLAAAPYW